MISGRLYIILVYKRPGGYSTFTLYIALVETVHFPPSLICADKRYQKDEIGKKAAYLLLFTIIISYNSVA
jgi:hypothetical protein